MGTIAATDMVAHADLETALRWHLQHNHYPPVPLSMLPACVEAIDLAVADEWDAEVSLPDGTEYRGRSVAPVWAVVEAHHLQPFVEQEETEWVVAGEDEHTYWSNDLGWVDLASADVFADGERDSLSLPLGGRWVAL